MPGANELTINHLAGILDQEVLDKARAYTAEVVTNHDKMLGQRFEHVDERLEMMEKQIAALTQGYMEATALIQALISSMMNDSPEKVAEFQQHVKASRQTYLDNLRHAADLAREGTDHFTAYAPDSDEQSESGQES